MFKPAIGIYAHGRINASKYTIVIIGWALYGIWGLLKQLMVKLGLRGFLVSQSAKCVCVLECKAYIDWQNFEDETKSSSSDSPSTQTRCLFLLLLHRKTEAKTNMINSNFPKSFPLEQKL